MAATEQGEVTLSELRDRPTVPWWPDAGRALGFRSRSATYRAIERGEIPVIRFGQKRIVVPTAELLRMIGIEPQT